MYCVNCGNELVDGARFCSACGWRAVDEPAVAIAADASGEETGGVSAALASGRSRSRLRITPLILLVLVLALTSAVAAASYYVYTQVYLPSVERGSYKAADAGTATSESDEQTSNDDAASINGWWRMVGNSQMSYHHIVDGLDYMYHVPPAGVTSSDGSTWSNLHYSGTRSIVSTEHYTLGEVPAATEECDEFTFEGGQTYFLYPSDNTMLVCIRADASGYSGSSSLQRTDELSDELLQLASEVEKETQEPTTGSESSDKTDYHISSAHYEFDLPEYWRGRVTVVQDGDDTTIYAKAAYDAGYELPLARLFLENSGYARIRGDISNKAIFDQEYGGDQSVFAWAHTPCLVAYYGYHNDGMSIEEIASRYYQGASTDLLDDYLDLSSGGSLGVDDMAAVHADISELSCYAQYALPPLIQVNP